jgi:hypothetical protein
VSAYRNLLSVRVPVSALAAFITQQGQMLLGDAHPTPFPADVRYVRAYHDPEADTLMLVFEHSSFPKTYEGAHVMRVEVVTLNPPPAADVLTTGTGDET